MIAAQYGIDCNESDIDGIICISHTLRIAQGLSKIETPFNRRLYYEIMMKTLKHLVKKSSFYSEEEKKEVMKTKLFKEYDEIVTAKNMGLNHASEYYDLLDLKPKVLKIKVPTLFILAENDPFTSADWIPIEEINKSEYVAFITTKEGGHVSFCQGFDNKVSYSEEVSLDFCKCISEIKSN
jgi:predicted alpha/beta-fold hydrolase